MKTNLFKRKKGRLDSSLFLRTFSLLVMLVVGIGVSWATDYTTIANFKHLESDFQASGTDQLLSGNGCNMVRFSWSGIENTTETIGGNKYYKFADNNSYVKVKFYHEYNPNAPFVAGDIVRVHLMVTDANVDPGFILKSDKGTPNKTVLGEKQSVNTDITVSYTLTENDINSDGSISIYRTGGGYATRYYSFEVAMKRYNHDVIMSQTTGGSASFMVTSGNASCALNTPVTRASVSNNATVKLANTPNTDILFWGWQVKNGDTWKASWDIQGFNAENYAVTSLTEIRPNFTEGIKINAYPNNGSLGSINISGGGQNGTNIHITPYPGSVTFTATPNAGVTFGGWYSDVDFQNLVTKETTLTYTNSDGILTTTGTINRWAKFIAPASETEKNVYMYDLTKFPEVSNAGNVNSTNYTAGVVTMVTHGGGNNYVKLLDWTDEYKNKNYTGVRIDAKGDRFRVVVKTSDSKSYEAFVEEANYKTHHFKWSDFVGHSGEGPMPADAVAKITEIGIAGNTSGDDTQKTHYISHIWLDAIYNYYCPLKVLIREIRKG